MPRKTKEIKRYQSVMEGVVINDFLQPSFLKELEKKLGKGLHLISNHIDFIVIKESKRKGKDTFFMQGAIHMGHPTPSDYAHRKIEVKSRDKILLGKIIDKK